MIFPTALAAPVDEGMLLLLTTSATPVLVRRAVDGLLSRGRGVDGNHQTFDDTKVVVNNLGEGRGSWSCRTHLRSVVPLINTKKKWRICVCARL
jgi:hypothetical protein